MIIFMGNLDLDIQLCFHQIIQNNMKEQNINQGAPIDIVFKNLNYTIKMADQSKTCFELNQRKWDKKILNDLTGIVQHGKITAIMGATGAGKTSLLNVLAHKIQTNKNKIISGTITANKVQYDYQSFSNFANYVMQKDILMESLTVRQTLQFAINLRYQSEQMEKQQILMKIINKMKLEKCIDTLVGGSLQKSISGGQKKRLSIAFQLISDPQVLFLDQPTSGLDSLTAFVIISYLKELANKGKTILLTIHQPNNKVFNKIDNLFILLNGKFIYQGTQNKVEIYFQNIGFKTPLYTNPSDYFMSLIHYKQQNSEKIQIQLYNHYLNLIYPKINVLVENQLESVFYKRSYNLPFCTSLKYVLMRDQINFKRNLEVFYIRFASNIILSLLFGGYFWNLSADYTLQGLSPGFTGRAGSFFCMGLVFLLFSVFSNSTVFPREKPLALKQQNNKLYPITTYFICRNLIQLPFLILTPITSCCIMYWMMNLSVTPTKFFTFVLFFFFILFSGNSLGLCVGTFFTDQKVAASFALTLVFPLIAFSGFYKNFDSFPNWIGWIQYVSPLKYVITGFLNNQFSNTNAPLYLFNLQFEIWQCIIALLAISFLARIISYIVLIYDNTRLE